jgi:hypothetical protein
MPLDQIRLLLLIGAITLVSGIGDSQGFIHASRMWQNGTLVWEAFAKSALGFTVGIGSYWVSIRYLQQFGVIAPEAQTLIWFGVTIIGVAVISGRFFAWQTIDQAIALLVFLGICWLLFRTGG